MRVALIGALGQLGTALSQTLKGEIVPLGHDAIEITDSQSVEAALRGATPDAVINCAAYNLVDKAEDEPQVAYLTNAIGPRNLALACNKLGVPLLHVSSDYVFGNSGPRQRGFTESDLPSPQGAYAVSKLAGEYFVRAYCPQHYVVRTCGLYGHATTPGKGNFIKTMLRLGKERGEVSVVDDQRCTPSSALDVARGLAALVSTGRFGLYHLTNSGDTSWCRLAAEAFRVAGLNVKVNPITTAQFNAKAHRPPFSVLDCSYFAAVTSCELPSWQQAVAAYIQTL
jgi:dTDP-4-dehydrorhamnose reductase